MGGLFISYRHGDTREFSERLYTRLCQTIPAERIFFDREIPLGMDWEEHLENALAACSVLIAVIGKSWSPLMEDGRPRLRAARDHVKGELSAAFRRGLTVIPVLVAGAEMPRTADLPRSLSRLPKVQALTIGEDFEASILKLIQRLQPLLEAPAPPNAERSSESEWNSRSKRAWIRPALGIGLAAVIAASVWYHQALFAFFSGVSLKDPGSTILVNGRDAWISWVVLGLGVSALAGLISLMTHATSEDEDSRFIAGVAAFGAFLSVLGVKGVVMLFANGALWFAALAGIFVAMLVLLTAAAIGATK